FQLDGAIVFGTLDGPKLFIVRPFDGGAPAPGNGPHAALLAPNRAAVDAFHAAALANGGSCEGTPGLRPHYHAHYYAAYVRDPDGNKLQAVC
ncbi:VOC family protein, partial [Acinetobacter baumannii]